MSINKKALIRYYAIDRCLSNPGRIYYIEDLLEAVNIALEEEGIKDGIKRRQLYDDLNFIELNWSAPIERYQDGKRKYFRYDDTKFSINNQPLNDTEINKLKDAIAIISRFKGMPQFSWVEEILTKINYGLGVKGDSKEIIGFDNNEYLQGIEHIGTLFESIFYKKVLAIEYKPYKTTKSRKTVFHPYFLKQYNNRWFVFGFNEDFGKVSNLALDRIQKVSEAKGKYNEDAIPDFNEYFEDIIGVTRYDNAGLEKIIVRISKDRAPYIITKPLHGSQKKIKEDESGYYFSIEVIPNNEFYQQVLSFVPDMEIIQPKSIRNILKEKLKEGLKCYK